MADRESTTPPGSPVLSSMPFAVYPMAEPAAPTMDKTLITDGTPTMDEIAALFNTYSPSPEHETIQNFMTSHDEALKACESDASHVHLNNLVRDSLEAVNTLQSLLNDQRERYMALAKNHVRRLRVVKDQECRIIDLAIQFEEDVNPRLRDPIAQVLELKQKLKEAEQTIGTLVSEGNAEEHIAKEKQAFADAEISALRDDLAFSNERLTRAQEHNEDIMITVRRLLDSGTAATAITKYADYASDEWWKMHARLVEKEGVELKLVAYQHYFEAETTKHQTTIQKLTHENGVFRGDAEAAQYRLDMNEASHAAALEAKEAELKALQDENDGLQSTIDAYNAASDEAHALDWTWHPIKQRFDAVYAEIEPLKERIKELEQTAQWYADWEVWEQTTGFKPTDPMVVARGKGYADLVWTLREERKERQEAEERWDGEKLEWVERVMKLEGKVRELGGKVEGDGGAEEGESFDSGVAMENWASGTQVQNETSWLGIGTSAWGAENGMENETTSGWEI